MNGGSARSAVGLHDCLHDFDLMSCRNGLQAAEYTPNRSVIGRLLAEAGDSFAALLGNGAFDRSLSLSSIRSAGGINRTVAALRVRPSEPVAPPRFLAQGSFFSAAQART